MKAPQQAFVHRLLSGIAVVGLILKDSMIAVHGLCYKMFISLLTTVRIAWLLLIIMLPLELIQNGYRLIILNSVYQPFIMSTIAL